MPVLLIGTLVVTLATSSRLETKPQTVSPPTELASSVETSDLVQEMRMVRVLAMMDAATVVKVSSH